MEQKSYCPNCNSYQLSKDINYLGDEKYDCPNCNEKPDTWTITVHLTVFAGDMDKEDVISNAENILDDITDGTDFISYNVFNATRDEQ